MRASETVLADVPFKYDVAFSFLAGDEGVAVQLNDLLQGRMITFLYSERQAELAGADGESVFNRVFSEVTRSVVVLYREGWGQTPWTRIEETAIRNRGHVEGYDFCLFVPLDLMPAVPRWLPRHRLWIGLDRWGVAGAAAVIEARVQELGGKPHRESLEDFATRQARDADFASERTAALTGYEATTALKSEADNVAEALGLAVERFNSVQQTLNLEFHRNRDARSPTITGLKHGFSFSYRLTYTNTLDESEITINLWRNFPPLPGFQYFERPTIKSKRTIRFDYSRSGKYVWIFVDRPDREYSSLEFAEEILHWYVEQSGDTAK